LIRELIKQQKLGKRNTYTPCDASQVPCSVTKSLNKEETLSELGLKTFPNNLDVNLRSSMTERNMSVFVVNLQNTIIKLYTSIEENNMFK